MSATITLEGNSLQVWTSPAPTQDELDDIQARLRTVDPECRVQRGPGKAMLTITFDGRNHTSYTGVLTIPIGQ